MKVFVIMGNDYPDKVFSRKIDADAFVRNKMNEQKSGIRIYWRVYEFDLIQSSEV